MKIEKNTYASWSALNETEWSVLRCGRSAHNECGQNTGWTLELTWSWCGGGTPPPHPQLLVIETLIFQPLDCYFYDPLFRKITSKILIVMRLLLVHIKCLLYNFSAEAKLRSGQKKRERGFFLEETAPNNKENISDHIQIHYLKRFW